MKKADMYLIRLATMVRGFYNESNKAVKEFKSALDKNGVAYAIKYRGMHSAKHEYTLKALDDIRTLCGKFISIDNRTVNRLGVSDIERALDTLKDNVDYNLIEGKVWNHRSSSPASNMMSTAEAEAYVDLSHFVRQAFEYLTDYKLKLEE